MFRLEKCNQICTFLKQPCVLDICKIVTHQTFWIWFTFFAINTTQVNDVVAIRYRFSFGIFDFLVFAWDSRFGAELLQVFWAFLDKLFAPNYHEIWC